MPNVFFTSDLHFGHQNVIRFDNRPFDSVEQMDNELRTRWNNRVSKQDVVYVLGDISWYGNEKTYDIISSLNGQKHLIKGNHDKLSQRVKSLFVSVSGYSEITYGNKQRIVLCHYPIIFYNGQHSGATHFYGHVHTTAEYGMVKQYIADSIRKGVPCKMFNVGCMIHNYEPATFEEIVAGNF